MIFMLRIDSIIKKIPKTVEIFNEHDNKIIKSKHWKSLRALSISKLNNNDDIDEEWISLAKLMEEEILPLEACIIFSKYINFNKDIVSFDVNYLNSVIVDILYEKTDFYLSGYVLLNYIKSVSNYITDKYKKSLLIRKFNNLKKIKLNTSISILVGVKFNNFNKIEVFKYIPQLENYIYIVEDEITIFNFETGKNIEYIKQDVIIDNTYKKDILLDYSVYFENIQININNDYERMIIYEIVKNIYEEERKINKDSKLANIIMDNINLFSNSYKKAIHKCIQHDIRTIINESINELRKNPDNEKLKELIYKSNNTEEIFTLIKLGESLIDEVRVDNYVDAICKCYYFEKNNSINDGNKRLIALFCEDIIASKPIVFTEVIDILKEMYNERIFTNKTLDTLKYIRHTAKDEKIIDEVMLQCKYSNNKFDNEFVKKICDIQQNNGNKNSYILDEMLNKFIYNVEDFSEYDDRIIKYIYDFYIRNNDKNTLIKLCQYAYENNLQLKSLNINLQDIYGLLKIYNERNKNYDVNLKLKIINEFKDDEKILNYGKVLLEKIYNIKNYNIVYIINKDYEELFKILRKRSTKLFESYINVLEYLNDKEVILTNKNNFNQDDIEEMILILNKDNVLKNTKISILNNLINYFIDKNNIINMIKYMEIYINEYSNVDDGKLFKKTIYKNSSNVELMEKLIHNIDFKDINNAEIFLRIIADELYTVGKLDLIPDILKYFIDNEKYGDSIDILKRYISPNYKINNIIKNNNIEIDEIIYDCIIDPILSNLDYLYKKEIYDILVLRDDLTMNIRDKYFYLCKSDENKKYLAKGFVKGEIDSLKAKEFAAEIYFHDDDMFCNIINIGDCSSNFICDLVYKKAITHFENNKSYIGDLLKNIYKADARLAELFKYYESYIDNAFNLEEKTIFGHYKCIKKENDYGKYSNKVYLTNIFNDTDTVEGMIFLGYDNKLYKIIRKYWDKIDVNYTIIDGNRDGEEGVIIINEKQDISFMLQKEKLNEFIYKIKCLIELQLELIKNNILMMDFSEKSMIINEKGIIPYSFYYISDYKDEFEIKDETLYKNISEININNCVKINEKNICIAIRKFLKNYLDMVIEKYNNSNIQQLVETVLNNNDIKTYKSLKLHLEEFELKLGEFKDQECKTFENISYKEKIEKFNELEQYEKLDVVEEIISKKDTELKAKKIVINYNDMILSMENYILYLIGCFCDFNKDLDKNDINNIYSIVNKYLCNVDEEVLKLIKNELSNFYISAKNIHKMNSEILKDNVSKLKINEDYKRYLVSRL